MNGYSAAVLGNLDQNLQDGNLHENDQLSPVNPQPHPQVNKSLSASRLAMRAIKALPVEIEIEITAQEAEFGTNRSVEINDSHSCAFCTNLKPINRLQCANCKGFGYVQTKRTVEISLSAGLQSGQKITYEGLGRYDFRSNKNSDLIVVIKAA